MVEMWLYAVYVAAVFLCFRRGFGAVFLIAVAVAFSGGVLYVSIHSDATGWWHNGSLLGFLPYWWLGAAFVSNRFSAVVRQAAIPLALVWGCLTVVLVSGRVHTLAIVEVHQLILALLCGLAIHAVDLHAGGQFGKISRVGRAGYSVYAFHAPILVSMLVAGASWWFAVAVAIVFGLASYLMYERPLDAMGKRLATARSSAVAKACLEPPL